MMQINKAKIIRQQWLTLLCLLVLSGGINAQTCPENILDFSDSGTDWTEGATSGSYTVGTHTFDIAIDDTDNILTNTTEVGASLGVRIEPLDQDDMVTVTYSLSEIANGVSFAISDLDKKTGGSIQQEQVCVYGFLGGNPVPIMPTISSLDGSVDVNGNCATATTNSAISGQDESVLIEFDQCIDRIVIEYGSGPMAPEDPDESIMYVGHIDGFTSVVCGDCETCTDNILDMTNETWPGGFSADYTVGNQTYSIEVSDENNIIQDLSTDEESLFIGIEPNSNTDKITVCYNLSEPSDNVNFKVRDLDKKESASNQEEEICVFGSYYGAPVDPSITSYNGSVDVNGNCATATTNSAYGDEESVIVSFDKCVTQICIEYGSGPMAPADPTYSKIYIGDEFGFNAGSCEACEVCTENTLDLTNETWPGGSTADYTVGNQTYTIQTEDINNIVQDLSTDEESLFIGIEPNSNTDRMTVCYSLSEPSNNVFFKVRDLDKKTGNSNQQEEICVFGSLSGASVDPIITSYDGSVDINGNCATATTNSAYGAEESVLVRFDECVDEICIEYGSGPMAPADPTYSKIYIGDEFGFNAGSCGDGCDVCEPGDPGTLTATFPSLCLESSASAPATVTVSANGDAVVPAGYSLVYLLSRGDIVEQISLMPTFDVNEAGVYTVHGFVYDGALFDPATEITLGTTTVTGLNALLQQGGGDLCASFDLTGATTVVDNPSAGTLALDAAPACSNNDGTAITVSASHVDAPIVPDGYEVLYILTNEEELIIVESSTTPSFEILFTGNYTIHTLVYDPNSGLDLDVTTGAGIFLQLIDGNGNICGKLDVAGAPFTVSSCCDSGDPGTLTATFPSLCFESSASAPATVTVSANGDAVVPAGYSLVYLLSRGDIVEQISLMPTFDVNEAGVYTVHGFVYDGALFDPATEITLGTTTVTGLNALLQQGGGDLCASFDLTGATTVVDNPSAGTLALDAAPACSNNDGTAITVSASHVDAPIVPDGYEVLYILTNEEELIIVETSTTPSFEILFTGNYTIHTLVYDPNSGLDLDVTTGAGIFLQLIDGNGNICGKLDVAGAPFTVSNCCDSGDPGTLTATFPSLCLESGATAPATVTVSANGDAVVPAGYSLIYLLSLNGIIEQLSTMPSFDVSDSGIYTVHGFVYDALEFDINTIVPGTTSIVGLNAQLDQGGGLTCASLDLTGATTVVASPSAGTLAGTTITTCSDGSGTATTLTAVHVNDPVVPDGYTVLYILSDGAPLTILDTNTEPTFQVTTPGNYIIHTLVYDPASGLDATVSSLLELYIQLIDGNGSICGKLDLSGGAVPVPSCKDNDKDNILDDIDLDDDNDGIPDLVEAMGVDPSADDDGDIIPNYEDTDYPNFADVNGDGINDIFDADSDGIPDIFDLDSDNDGVPDIMEVVGSTDIDVNGIVDNFSDIDSDGLHDGVDFDNNNTPSTGDALGTPYTIIDTDGDNVMNFFDLDSDNDGITDLVEAGGSEIDGNGMIDNFVDNDADGFAELVDTDNNEVAGLNDGPGEPLPNPDTDNDGIRNLADLDSDNDEAPDMAETAGLSDFNGDGSIDNITDTDGDGQADVVDPDNGGITVTIFDTDGDLVFNHIDLDSDNDGIADIIEIGGRDIDRNGITDSPSDVDKDGLFDSIDPNNNLIQGDNDGVGTPHHMFVNNVYTIMLDNDGDGISNFVDLDSDNDGLSDLLESIGDLDIYATIDADNNGLVDGFDADNDGIVDLYDNNAVHGGFLMLQPLNSDADALFNFLDIDADNDGIVDLTEGQTTASFIAPMANGMDSDNDGINDAFDGDLNGFGGFVFTAIDTDADGEPDYLDLNSDNDSEPDAIEGFDFNGDGEPEFLLSANNGDNDGDGLDAGYDDNDNLFDPTNDNLFPMMHPDADGGNMERDWRDPLECIAVEISLFLEGALVDLDDPNNFLSNMRASLNVDRGLLPGQTPSNGLVTPTPAGQPYNTAPWNYNGDEGLSFTDADYANIANQYGQQVVDWVLVSIRTSTAVADEIAKVAGLLLQDGTVVFLDNCFLPANGYNNLFIVVEHRNHMAAMAGNPVFGVPIIGGRLSYDFRSTQTYVGPDPINPLGVGQKVIGAGFFALYGSDAQQIDDANVSNNPSYNVTGADKLLWEADNGIFDAYRATDFDMDGDVRGADKIIYTLNNGLFSVVPR